MSSTTAGVPALRYDFLARDEGKEWLLFDTVKHSVDPVTEEHVTKLEASGKVVRRIQRPPLPGALSAPLKLFVSVSNRCNLTVMEVEGQADLADFLAANRVDVVASLPCYTA
ncbi:hypothetical protein, partial [Actinomadura viridis]|uniref:hypothetical protein n=1 Tax=Actinomadura viridis TaxID=58110 RepID=UPI0031EDC501